MTDILFIAVAILMAPDVAEVPVQILERYEVRWAVKSLAITWELMDERENRYFLIRKDDYESEVNMLRTRREELKGAPTIADSIRFGNRKYLLECIAANRVYYGFMEKQQQVYGTLHWQAYQSCLEETNRLYSIWDWASDAVCPTYYVTCRRNALKNLREAIGNDMYYRGQLPSYLPIWRMRDID